MNRRFLLEKLLQTTPEVLPDNALLDSNGNYLKATDSYLVTTESTPMGGTFTLNIDGNNALHSATYNGNNIDITLSSQEIEIVSGATFYIRTPGPRSMFGFDYVKLNNVEQTISQGGSGNPRNQYFYCELTPQDDDVIDVSATAH